MKSPFVLLAQLLVCTGGITGRKKLQKMVHILQSQGIDFGFNFRLGLYGAYSSDLSCQMEELVSCHLVGEKASAPEGYPTSLFQAEDKILSALEALGENSTPKWVDLAKKLNAKTPQELEGASTVIFLENVGLQDEALRNQFQAIKPHLSQEFEAAAAFAASLQAA